MNSSLLHKPSCADGFQAFASKHSHGWDAVSYKLTMNRREEAFLHIAPAGISRTVVEVRISQLVCLEICKHNHFMWKTLGPAAYPSLLFEG